MINIKLSNNIKIIKILNKGQIKSKIMLNVYRNK